jgi:hypothetical protein
MQLRRTIDGSTSTAPRTASAIIIDTTNRLGISGETL